MKVQAVIVLMVILLSALLPASLPFQALYGGEQAIGEPDVCHSASPAISGCSEMFFLNECNFLPVPTVVVSYFVAAALYFSQDLFRIRNERPPIA